MPVYVSEYQAMATGVNGGILPAGLEPSLADQTIAIGGTSTQSDAFHSSTRFVRVHTDALCHIAFGEDPTATTSIKRMPANQTEFFGVKGGHKIAVITGS